MIDKILNIILAVIWVAFFGYLFYVGYYAVAIISIIILAIALSFASNNN